MHKCASSHHLAKDVSEIDPRSERTARRRLTLKIVESTLPHVRNVEVGVKAEGQVQRLRPLV